MAANNFLFAALSAAERNWPVFPLSPGTKIPAIKRWEQQATTDEDQIRQWWANNSRNNIGIACRPAGLVVLDLDAASSPQPPPEWAELGVAHGSDVLRVLAERAGQPDPLDTYTVITSSGGQHRYFLAPSEPELRNTTGNTAAGLGWLIDTRAAGGAIVAAGSVRRLGGAVRRYRVVCDLDPVALPNWLVTALTPPPAPTRAPVPLPTPGARLDAYVQAALDGETAAVAQAIVGTRAHTLFCSAARLGELVGAGVLDESRAAAVLLSAAATLDSPTSRFTQREASGHITNGIARGRRNPRSLPGHRASEE